MKYEGNSVYIIKAGARGLLTEMDRAVVLLEGGRCSRFPLHSDMASTTVRCIHHLCAGEEKESAFAALTLALWITHWHHPHWWASGEDAAL